MSVDAYMGFDGVDLLYASPKTDDPYRESLISDNLDEGEENAAS